MTTLNSICLACEHLWITNNEICISQKGEQSIPSECLCYSCGKNQGNRKSCKKFSKADNDIILQRIHNFTKFTY